MHHIPRKTLPLKRNDLTMTHAVHTVIIRQAHTLTNAAKDLFEMLQGLGDGECFVLDRQAQCVHIFEIEEALRLDAGEFIIIQNPCGTGVVGESLGE